MLFAVGERHYCLLRSNSGAITHAGGEVFSLSTWVIPDYLIQEVPGRQRNYIIYIMDIGCVICSRSESKEYFRKDGFLILNGDNKYCLDLYKRADFLDSERKKIYSISRSKINSDIWTEDIIVSENYISFLTINEKGELMHFKVNVLGRHNVQNLYKFALCNIMEAL